VCELSGLRKETGIRGCLGLGDVHELALLEREPPLVLVAIGIVDGANDADGGLFADLAEVVAERISLGLVRGVLEETREAETRIARDGKSS